MILLAMSNIELIFLLVTGLIVFSLIVIMFLQHTKKKVEKEIDVFSEEHRLKEKVEVAEKLELKDFEKQLNFDDVLGTITETEKFEDKVDEKTENEKAKEKRSEIEILLEQMQSDLKKQEKDPIHTFEEEQEEKSIISYQELKAMKEKQSHASEIENYEKEQEEFSLTNSFEIDRENLSMAEENDSEEDEFDYIPKRIEKENKVKSKEKNGTYSRTEFISPVYGKMENKELDYPKIPNFKEEFQIHHDSEELHFDDVKVNLKSDDIPDLEHTFDLGPISEETKKNDEFLKALKEFRNNLE